MSFGVYLTDDAAGDLKELYACSRNCNAGCWRNKFVFSV